MNKIFALVAFCIMPLLAKPYCSKENARQDLTGEWESSNSYYYKIATDKQKHICIEVYENGKVNSREIRDILIVDGYLKAFMMYNPNMGTFVLTYDIVFPSGDTAQYNWVSSYGSSASRGTDTMTRRK